MTKNFRLLAASCVALLGLVFGMQHCVAGSCETGDLDNPIPIPGCFYVSRDTAVNGHAAAQLNSTGEAGRIRGLKFSQDVAILDFDGVAIRDYIEANPGVVSAEFFIHVADRLDNGQNVISSKGVVGGDVGIQTVESLNDWAEGNGDTSGAARNWSIDVNHPERTAATYFYASTLLDSSGNLDNAGSLEWVDPDSGPYTFTSRAADHAAWGVTDTVGGGGTGDNPTPEFTNSAKFTPAGLLNSWGNGEHTGIALDAAIVNAIAYDENNRGIRLGETFLAGGALDNGVGSNWRFYDKDNGSTNNSTPYLQLTISAGEPGDFDFDSDVDGADFLEWQRGTHTAGDLTLWQDNYGTGVSLQASVSSVPEPSSIALLALSSALLFTRRNSRK